jgi:hypothetical protein
MKHSPECLSANTALGLGMDTDTIGLALIVGGAAFVCCGLVFMLPVRRRRSTVQEDAEEGAA